MIDSILDSCKRLCSGISPDDTSYDLDIITFVNSVFVFLFELGIDHSFHINSSIETWSDYMVPGPELDLIKSYIPLRVRILFDPPQSSTLLQALKDQCNELEARLGYLVDPIYLEKGVGW